MLFFESKSSAFQFSFDYSVDFQYIISYIYFLGKNKIILRGPIITFTYSSLA